MAAESQNNDGNVQTMARHISISGIAHEFGMARETVKRRLDDAGVRPDGKGKGWDVFRLRDAMPAILAKSIAAQEGNLDPDTMQPKERLDFFRSETEKLKLDRARGEVVPVDQVREELAFVVKTVVQALETMPDILERDCGLDPATVLLVEREFDALRDALAARLETGATP